ncbi:MAG TPA: glycosyl hydrolase family 65 protein [Gordonia sp. (in: high G+C Gram-positive bacteria)]|uniref:glycoside hydrolase family 65 protein n=1 Tax=unclassified Gordonia (in: high G+C Gram-positive bacteria) TaxID=2657482 RepID=UPI000FB05FDD|nr:MULTISPECIES: glycosyl hydrolase family 65 protein [unclassified Gordonia (in: high G+C Gram-positive bacteria)]RUP36672.1 MAG: glycoside hydrolase family 65 protein [Gordonia sp. (in: high G+C Gram-positive bacteria)]HNP57388.1 glycosyl hydrolase family 65 protein [Gordonia sp. (in: high G+C Gram-positive bacteria)]HRC50735.1 glycosyl hydrolase family 65 protein [Gordonia sp. (in: high G+C Gram-positive bacteria)]
MSHPFPDPHGPVREMGFEVHPWQLKWNGLRVDMLSRTESLFALSNGHIGLRGTFEEGEPTDLPGSYLNGFYELRDLPYAESGYGYPESGQTVVNVTDGKIIRLLVEDEPMDLRYGTTEEHSRTLDFRTGTLRRETVWTSPTGRRVRIRSERLVSFTKRAIAAIHYEVEPLSEDMTLVLQSDLLANEPIPIPGNDPRLAAALDAPLVADLADSHGYSAVLVHHTRNSQLHMAAGMDHTLEMPSDAQTSIRADGDLARLTISTTVPRGQKVSLTKYIGYGWSGRRSVPALRAQVEAALALAVDTGWEELVAQQTAFLDDFWHSADIELDGDPELQQAVRFALFHVLQAGARGESRAIPAKGLTGPGYDGHAFWDTESFVLPMLTYTLPAAAGEELRWRHATMDKAKARAAELGQKGAMFPWRSINGDECSGYWPAGTAGVHVSADIANAVAKYLNATGDEQFDVECGVELLVETARLFSGTGHFDMHNEFRIDGVTGPDEYTAIVNNNVFTNLAVQQNLRDAVSAVHRQPEVARALGVTDEETARWEAAADAMAIPYDEKLEVHPQCESFTLLGQWDFEGSKDRYPLLLNYPYFDLYRKQVVKQADLVFAMYTRGDVFDDAAKKRNFDYYYPLTVRDSSLSACCEAVVAAEVGYLELAYDLMCESVFTDLHDLHANVASGLHIAALAGAWTDCVAGFGGMRDFDGNITFAPRLPKRLNYMSFRMIVRGSSIVVAVDRDSATYRLLSGPPIELAHHGEKFLLEEDTPVTKKIAKRPALVAPQAPPGCAPYQRPE